MTLVMYFNPRSLPGYAYSMSDKARYEFHVSRAAGKTSAPTGESDVRIRFEAQGPADAAGAQEVKFSVVRDGELVGEKVGMSTGFGDSKAGSVVANDAAFGGYNFKWFIGARQDGFHFDVIRYFQVRAFAAARFFGFGTEGDPTATLANNCRGDQFLSLLSGGATEAGGQPDADLINLFNPPECAPDFTKNYNITSVTVNVPVALLQANGESVFDTWSTISVRK